MGYMSQTLLRGVNFLSYDHTPELASNVWTIRLLGNVPLSQDAECRCISLAGNSSISLAGNEGQINFSQQSPKMLKMASESFIHALLFLGLFLKIVKGRPCRVSFFYVSNKVEWTLFSCWALWGLYGEVEPREQWYLINLARLIST